MTYCHLKLLKGDLQTLSHSLYMREGERERERERGITTRKMNKYLKQKI
jgi:hypothetical protein